MPTPVLAPFLGLAAVFAVMVTVLGLRVSLMRVALGGISLGDGGDAALQRRIRAHGNFAEYAPLELLAVLAAGLAGLPPWLGWALAAAFALTRLTHAWAIAAEARTPFRAAAMILQHLSMLVAAGAILTVLVQA